MQEKTKITLLVMWITSLGQAAITLTLPAFPAIAHYFNVAPAAIKSSLSIFMVSFGASQLIYGPLSERYGRKLILLIGLIIFCLGCLGSCFVTSFHLFLISRFIQALGVGSVITLGRSILRDKFSGVEFASAASYLSMGFAIGFGGTPIIGALLQHYFGWRADFIFLLFIGFSLYLIMWKWLPETALRHSRALKWRDFLTQTLNHFQIVLREGLFWQFLLAGLFAYGIVIAYNVMTPFLLQDMVGISTSYYGLLALFIATPYYFGAAMNRSLVKQFGARIIFLVGNSMMIVAGLAILILEFIFKLELWIIIIPMMLATLGQALVFSNTISGALQKFAAIPGTASASFSSLQMLLISLLSFVMAILPDVNQLSLGLTVLILGTLSALILQVPTRLGFLGQVLSR